MIGRTIGHYRITSLLGGGGMGVVYRAEDLNLGRTVALKFLPPELTRDQEAKLRFEREARAASLLDHPNICTIFDFGEANGDDGQMYMAMPCYDGESLASKIDHGLVPVDAAIRIVEQIARGLGKAHAAGVVHRDIKPANVMITADGIVKILDFGLAKLTVASNITKSHTTMGTAAYMAPEQIRGEQVGPQADIWSLGIVLFELLTGRRPFRGEYPEALTYAILNEQPATFPGDPELDRVIKRMLRKDPLQRYQSVEDVLPDLEPFKTGSSPSARVRAAVEREKLKNGARLGPYEIVKPIAGDVYLARDIRLDRQVAIKVLPPEFPDKERFRSEAKAVSQLHASSICTLFDVGEQEGVDYVVMELLDGEMLAQKRMPMPIQQVLRIGVQIAEGLAAAHAQGIVHRNLTPANVMITKSGAVKLLNFGMPSGVTAYIAPEQVEGEGGDALADIFALGAILYEMIAGRHAFAGASAVEIKHALLNDEPPPLEAISPALEETVRHCLEKNPRDRFQSAHDLAFQLRMLPEVQRSITASQKIVPPRRPLWYRIGIVALPLLLALAAAGLVWRGFRRPTSPAIWRTYRQLTSADGMETFPTLAPDGKSFAYVSSQSGNRDIYVQRVDERTAINITADSLADDSEPAFSPDGSKIAFRSEREGGGIFVMGATGDSPKRLTDFGHNPAWSPDGARIVLASDQVELIPLRNRDSELWIVDVANGARRPLVQHGKGGPDFGRDSDSVQPNWSPHGKRIAFWGVSSPSDQFAIWTIDPDAAEPKKSVVRVTSDAASFHWNPVWSPDGKYLYYGTDRDGTLNLWRAPMNEETGKPTGAPEPASLPTTFAGNFTFARSGELAYVAVTSSYRMLAVPFDVNAGKIGSPRQILAGSQEILSFHPSPDGKKIAYTVKTGRQEDIFVADADGQHIRQLTNDPAIDRAVQWAPDGRTLYFSSNRDGNAYRIWSILADGSGLTTVTDDRDVKPIGARDLYQPITSPDGRTLIVQTDRATSVLVHLDRPPGQRVESLPVFLPTPRWSPDGQFIVGRSSRPLSIQRVRANAFPGAIVLYSLRTGRAETLSDTGIWPHWTPDGKKIVYFERQEVRVLDLGTRGVTAVPFPQMAGASIDLRESSRVSQDATTLYVRQAVQQGDIWMARLASE